MHQDYYTMSGETSQLERVANFAHLWYNSLGALHSAGIIA